MRKQALVAVILTYLSWGVFPLFFKLLQHVNAFYVLAHRIIWAAVFSGAWLLIITASGARKRGGKQLFAGFSFRLVLSSLAIVTNWGLFIWAINNDYVSYAALGYFVSPLLSVLLGYLVFNEPISGRQRIAIALTATAALVYGWGHSGIGVLIVFGVAITFSSYGALKKTMKIDAVPGMFIESAILVPFALGLLLTNTLQPGAALDGVTWALLVVSGLVTLLPLVVLSHYSREVPLSSLGMLHFIVPIMQLSLGVVVFGEAISGLQLVSLVFIALGVCLYFYAIGKPAIGR